MKEKVEVDGVALCSSLQVCGLIRKRAVLQGTGLSIRPGMAAFAMTFVFGTELWLGESCFLDHAQLLKVACKRLWSGKSP